MWNLDAGGFILPLVLCALVRYSSCEGFWRPVVVHCPLVTMSYELDRTVLDLHQILPLQIAFLPSLSFVVNPVDFLLLQSRPQHLAQDRVSSFGFGSTSHGLE